MQTTLIVLHLMIVVALVIVVLLQRSEGGALGIGGGGGGGFLTGRGTANVLTRTTAILALCFFATSIALAILAGYGVGSRSVIDTLAPANTPGGAQPIAPDPQGTGGGQGGGAPAQPEAPQPQQAPAGPQVPQSQ
jgi:preprotein translocase subunit SecG